MLGWNEMFSAITGFAPARMTWMGKLANKIDVKNWYQFGIIFGAIRFTPMLPGIILLGNYWGLLFVGMGYVYYLCGKFSKYACGSNKIAVTCAEIVMGYAIGLYLVSSI
jgi:hypothetical protein